MPFTLREANLHSPRTLMNRIVRRVDQMADQGRLVASDVFPLVELSDSTETHFRQSGIRTGMTQTGLASESPVGDIESLTEDDVTVETFKKKMAPEKGVDTELNTDQEILNLFNATADALTEDVLLTRSINAWRGQGSIDGMIGPQGDTPHPDLPTTHVIEPGTAYSDTSTSTPITDFVDAEYFISQDGSELGQAGGITAYMTPGIIRDLKLNDDIQSEYDNLRVLSEQQLTDAFQIDQIREIRTQVVRRDESGVPLDEDGNQVDSVEDAATDNILEPYDASGGTARRNIVIGAPGQVSAFQPWFLDRLAERGEATPTGQVEVDASNGWLTQTWTEVDPMVSWYKAAQEVGFHLMRPNNWFVIHDV